MDENKIMHPAPRRPGAFSLTPVPSTAEMGYENQSPTENQPSRPFSTDNRNKSAGSFQKSRSILNLTSSTLFGIYSPTGDDTNRDDSLNTPWGTGSQTPIRKTSTDNRSTQYTLEKVQEKINPIPSTESGAVKAHVRARSFSGVKRPVSKTRRIFSLFVRSAALFLIGLAYGTIITQLHNTKGLAPVHVENVDRSSWAYLGFWGASGLVLGNLLPWVDRMWSLKQDQGEDCKTPSVSVHEKSSGFGVDKSQEIPSSPTEVQARNSLGADWNPVVRSIGAFVGIAFAIRRLPWQSTLQVSLTLALANPVIWYLLDRSRNGFFLSLAFSLTGASALLSINPAMLPTPRMQTKPGMDFVSPNGQRNASAGSNSLGSGQGETAAYETIALATWIASVLFCSCVCFGNIGRRLVPGTRGSWSM